MTDNTGICIIVLILMVGIVLFQRGCSEWTATIQENNTERMRIEAL